MTSPFVLPDGLSLALGGNSIVIRHSGDIVLEQSLGRKISRVDCGGDLTLSFGPITGALRAEGKVVVEGQVDAQEIRGDVILVGDHDVRARALIARTRVEIGRATVDIDVVVAPEVIIHPDATGRIRIVDCLNERPPLRVRGCLSLDEFEQDFGGAAEFLARRGVIPINPLPVPAEPDHDAAEDDLDAPRFADPGRPRSAQRGLLTSAPARPPEPRPRPEAPVEPASVVASRAAAPVPVQPPAEAAPVAPPAEVTPPVAPRPSAPGLAVHAVTPPAPVAPPPASASAASVAPPPSPAAPPPASASPASVAPPPSPAVPPPASASPASVAPPAPAVTAEPTPPAAAAPAPEPEASPRRAPRPRKDLSRHEARLRRMISRIVAAYDSQPPDSVLELGRIAQSGRMDDLLSRLDDLWLDTLRHHVGAQTQPPRPVLVGFLSVNALISN
jgi:hypothetical protein